MIMMKTTRSYRRVVIVIVDEWRIRAEVQPLLKWIIRIIKQRKHCVLDWVDGWLSIYCWIAVKLGRAVHRRHYKLVKSRQHGPI